MEYRHFANYYDDWITSIDSHYSYFVENILPHMLKLLNLRSLKLCDLGCGTGVDS